MVFDPTNDYGYPVDCVQCAAIPQRRGLLTTSGAFQQGNNFKVMIVGQEPTLYDRRIVEVPLELNIPGTTLHTFIRNSVLGVNVFDNATIYATNAVKCTFEIPPTGHGKPLAISFANCQIHLRREIESFQPNVLISLGQPAYKLIAHEFGINDNPSMRHDFTGTPVQVPFELENETRDIYYSPCVHYRTANRWANVYNQPLSMLRDWLETQMNNN
jgi:uracil-DNA glycosylase